MVPTQTPPIEKQPFVILIPFAEDPKVDVAVGSIFIPPTLPIENIVPGDVDPTPTRLCLIVIVIASFTPNCIGFVFDDVITFA